jgi:hypothetical protein
LPFPEPNLKLSDAQPFFASKSQILIWTTVNLKYGGAIMAQHWHRFTIADDDAVRVLLAKLVKGGAKHGRRDRLLRALDDAARHYKDSNQKVRQAFFHGLLTGYAVALALR